LRHDIAVTSSKSKLSRSFDTSGYRRS
jgi:hypothetical protein